MKQNKAGGYFINLNENNLTFKSANELKGSVLMMFYVLFGGLVFVQIINTIRGEPSVFVGILSGSEPGDWIFRLPFILPIIWFFLPPTRVTLDRAQGIVHYKRGKRSYDFPWSQVNFKHQWLPTKTGGATLFTLIVIPPFPEALNRFIEKKGRRMLLGQFFTFKLGSFDVKGPEHGQAVFNFLDAWMRSREPAVALYESMVASRFGA